MTPPSSPQPEKGKEKEVVESEKKKYLEKVEKIKQQEIENNGYEPGIIYTSSFSLFYKSSKHKLKDCFVGEQTDMESLPIHTRQAIDEVVYYNGEQRCNWTGGKKSPKKYYEWECKPISQRKRNPIQYNYLLVNIGFVITAEAYPGKGHLIPRKFLSVPLYISPESEIVHKTTDLHSEKNLYEFLLIKENMQYVLSYFRSKLDIPNSQKRKIYTCILDLHSTRDMCAPCQSGTYEFQEKFIAKIKAIAPGCGLEINKNFKVIIRYSAALKSSVTNKLKKPYLYEKDFEIPPRTYTHEKVLDIKKSKSSFILHVDKCTREDLQELYKKEEFLKIKASKIPKRTVFWNTAKYSTSFVSNNLPEQYDSRQYNSDEKMVSFLMNIHK